MDPKRCIIFCRDQLCLVENEGDFSFPPFSRSRDSNVLNQFELEDGIIVADLPEERLGIARTGFHGLRAAHALLPAADWFKACRAFQLLHWKRTTRFCGACGNATADGGSRWSRKCPICGLEFFPVVTPAVIVAVTNGERILLARAARFTQNMFSVLAGFVEPGETLEECAAREVREETGVEIGDIRYFGSQPWPFPSGLMVAFTASYTGGDVKADGKELLEAGWFDREALPVIPGPFSIAHRLIRWFIDRENSGKKENRAHSPSQLPPGNESRGK